MADGIDKSALAGKSGLVKRHTVSGDSETTELRSAQELQDLDQFLRSSDCSVRRRQIATAFGVRMTPRAFVNGMVDRVFRRLS